MTLWHLAWMHIDLWLLLASVAATPFIWDYAFNYSTAERSQMKRHDWMLFRKNYSNEGLPCIPDHWAHGEMVDVPDLGRVCRSCGWLSKGAST